MILRNTHYLAFGILFGFFLTKSEVISWFRIQEMFRFQSFHMYGVIFSAIIVGFISLRILRGLKIKTMEGEPVRLIKKPYHHGTMIGGIIFGLGWALTGACPGPIFTLVGNGYSVFLITLLSALAGTWAYGLLREKLPH